MARFAWIYKTIKWQRVRLKVLRRDYGLCQECRRNGQVKPGNEVDHIIELTNDNVKDDAIVYGLGNLQTLCFECHRRKHGQEPSGLVDYINPVPRRE